MYISWEWGTQGTRFCLAQLGTNNLVRVEETWKRMPWPLGWWNSDNLYAEMLQQVLQTGCYWSQLPTSKSIKSWGKRYNSSLDNILGDLISQKNSEFLNRLVFIWYWSFLLMQNLIIPHSKNQSWKQKSIILALGKKCGYILCMYCA